MNIWDVLTLLAIPLGGVILLGVVWAYDRWKYGP